MTQIFCPRALPGHDEWKQASIAGLPSGVSWTSAVVRRNLSRILEARADGFNRVLAVSFTASPKWLDLLFEFLARLEVAGVSNYVLLPGDGSALRMCDALSLPCYESQLLYSNRSYGLDDGGFQTAIFMGVTWAKPIFLAEAYALRRFHVVFHDLDVLFATGQFEALERGRSAFASNLGRPVSMWEPCSWGIQMGTAKSINTGLFFLPVQPETPQGNAWFAVCKGLFDSWAALGLKAIAQQASGATVTYWEQDDFNKLVREVARTHADRLVHARLTWTEGFASLCGFSRVRPLRALLSFHFECTRTIDTKMRLVANVASVVGPMLTRAASYYASQHGGPALSPCPLQRPPEPVYQKPASEHHERLLNLTGRPEDYFRTLPCFLTGGANANEGLCSIYNQADAATYEAALIEYANCRLNSPNGCVRLQ